MSKIYIPGTKPVKSIVLDGEFITGKPLILYIITLRNDSGLFNCKVDDPLVGFGQIIGFRLSFESTGKNLPARW